VHPGIRNIVIIEVLLAEGEQLDITKNRCVRREGVRERKKKEEEKRKGRRKKKGGRDKEGKEKGRKVCVYRYNLLFCGEVRKEGGFKG
jgi:hypothetical protein